MKGRAKTGCSIANAEARFPQLAREPMVGEELVVEPERKPISKLLPVECPGTPRKPGSARGLVRMAPDFDATPEDFRGYA